MYHIYRTPRRTLSQLKKFSPKINPTGGMPETISTWRNENHENLYFLSCDSVLLGVRYISHINFIIFTTDLKWSFNIFLRVFVYTYIFFFFSLLSNFIRTKIYI